MLDKTSKVSAGDDDLELIWLYKDEQDKAMKKKRYGVVCRCGSREMIVAQNCLRCQECGLGHTFTALAKKKLEAKRLNDGKGTVSEIKRWVEPAPKENVIAGHGRILGKTDNNYENEILKMRTSFLQCDVCKHKFEWNGRSLLDRKPLPVIIIEGKQQCFKCLNSQMQ